MSSTNSTLISLIAILVAINTFAFIWYRNSKPKKRLYKVEFINGKVSIDSLMDKENTLENGSIKYPKTSIISYQEINK